MAEVLFYHLTNGPLEASLPAMLERSLQRGWRVIVRCGSQAGVAMLDGMLWTYRDDSFLPHGTSAAPHPDRQPIYLTLGDENPNQASVLMLVDGARATPAEIADSRAHASSSTARTIAPSPPPATTGARSVPRGSLPSTGHRKGAVGWRRCAPEQARIRPSAAVQGRWKTVSSGTATGDRSGLVSMMSAMWSHQRRMTG